MSAFLPQDGEISVVWHMPVARYHTSPLGAIPPRAVLDTRGRVGRIGPQLSGGWCVSTEKFTGVRTSWDATAGVGARVSHVRPAYEAPSVLLGMVGCRYAGASRRDIHREVRS